MKKWLFCALAAPIALWCAQVGAHPDHSESVASDHTFHDEDFDLETLTSLVEQDKVKGAAHLEEIINAEDSGINNVDVDRDGFVDYVTVREVREGDARVFEFMAIPSSNTSAERVKIASMSMIELYEEGYVEVVSSYPEYVYVIEDEPYYYTTRVVYTPHHHHRHHGFFFWAFTPYRPVYYYHHSNYHYSSHRVCHRRSLYQRRTHYRRHHQVRHVRRSRGHHNHTRTRTHANRPAHDDRAEARDEARPMRPHTASRDDANRRKVTAKPYEPSRAAIGNANRPDNRALSRDAIRDARPIRRDERADAPAATRGANNAAVRSNTFDSDRIRPEGAPDRTLNRPASRPALRQTTRTTAKRPEVRSKPIAPTRRSTTRQDTIRRSKTTTTAVNKSSVFRTTSKRPTGNLSSGVVRSTTKSKSKKKSASKRKSTSIKTPRKTSRSKSRR